MQAMVNEYQQETQKALKTKNESILAQLTSLQQQVHLNETIQTKFTIDTASIAASLDFTNNRVDQLIKKDFANLAGKFYELSDQFVKLRRFTY